MESHFDVLFTAVRCGDIDVVEELLRDNPNIINRRDEDNLTPLNLACFHGHFEIAELLISKGAEVSAEDKEGNTPLHWACYNGHFEIAELLISKGASVSVEDKEGSTPLHWACYIGDLKIAELLISKGARVEDKGTCAPLHFACYSGHLDIAELLIAKGANINARNKGGDTPLHDACYNNHFEIVNFLINSGADPTITNEDNRTAFYETIDPFVICLLVDNYPSLLTIKPSTSYVKSFFSDYLNPPYDRITKNSDAHLALNVLFNGLSSNASPSSATYRLHLCGEGLSGKSCLYAQLRSVLARNSNVSQSASPKDVSKQLSDNMDDRDIDDAMRGKYKVVIDHGDSGRTKGIRISTITSHAHRGAQIIMYDYGGQREFLINHGCFLSAEGSVYVIVLPLWNRKDDTRYEDDDIVARYSFWLRFIHSVALNKDKRCSMASRIPIITVINRFDDHMNLCRCGRSDVQLQILIGKLSSEFAHFRRHFIAVSSAGVSAFLPDCCIVVNCDIVDGANALIEPLQVAMNHLQHQPNTTFPAAQLVRDDIDGKRDWKLVMKHSEWTEKSSTCLVRSYRKISKFHDERVRDYVLDIMLRKALESLLQSGAMLKLPQLSADGDALYVTSPNELTNKILGALLHEMAREIREFTGNQSEALSDIVKDRQQIFDAIVSSLNLKGLITIDVLRSVGLAVPLSHLPSNKDIENASVKSEEDGVYYIVHGLLTNEMPADAARPFDVATRILIREFHLSNVHTDMFFPGYFAALFRSVLRLETDWTVKMWKNGINLRTSKSHLSLNFQFDVQVIISHAEGIEAGFRVMIATNEQATQHPDYALHMMDQVREIIYSGVCGGVSVTEFCESIPVDIVEMRMIANQYTSNRHYHRLFCGKYPDETISRDDMAKLLQAQGQMLLDHYRTVVETIVNSNESSTRYLDALLHKLFRASAMELRQGEEITLNAIMSILKYQSEESRRTLVGMIEDKIRSVINEFQSSCSAIRRLQEIISQLAELLNTHDSFQLLNSVVTQVLSDIEQLTDSHFYNFREEIFSIRTRLVNRSEMSVIETQADIVSVVKVLVTQLEPIIGSLQHESHYSSKFLEELYGRLLSLEKAMKGEIRPEDAERLLRSVLFGQLKDVMLAVIRSLKCEILDGTAVEIETKLQSIDMIHERDDIYSVMNDIESDLNNIRALLQRAESVLTDSPENVSSLQRDIDTSESVAVRDFGERLHEIIVEQAYARQVIAAIYACNDAIMTVEQFKEPTYEMEHLCNASRAHVIFNHDITIDDSARISSTTYAIVYRGTFRGTAVAIKMIRGDGGMHISARDLQQTEIELLSSLRHPRILTLMGVVLDLDLRYGAMCGLVTEYMTRGSLYSVLHMAETPPEHRLTSLSLKLRVLRDVVEGMRFLHSSNVIHRDLKSLNVLLDDEGRAKICDFGVSKILSMDMTHASTTCIGTPAWSSPEALLGDGGGIRQSSDVYSFGVILWEMLTNAIPWNGLTAIQLSVCISHGESLPIPPASEDLAPQELINILERCLNRIPDHRPTFEYIYEIIKRLLTTCRNPCPLEYRCPISHEIMEDPVICSDGQTYERANIERWLRDHNTSPISNAVLEDTSLRPNIILRGFIQTYLIEQGAL